MAPLVAGVGQMKALRKVVIEAGGTGVTEEGMRELKGELEKKKFDKWPKFYF